jgi:hypothetical protein
MDDRASVLRTCLRRWLEWGLLSEAIRRADVNSDTPAHAQAREFVARGRAAALAADRLLDPPEGSARAPELARALFVEASHWLLRAADVEKVEPDSLVRMATAAETAAPALAGWLALHRVPDVLSWSRETFAEPSTNQLRTIREVQEWVHDLGRRVAEQATLAAQLRAKRWLRIGPVLLGLFVALAFASNAALRGRQGPDLALGKPWRASSSAETCRPALGQCAGAYTKIFFVTNEEDSPWVEVDLLSSQQISRVEVANRRDFGADRAFPLLVELSVEGQKYFRVGDRTEPFTEWETTFTPQQARYVRLRVTKRTTFHLERISVRR